ncbi:MAG: metal-dependent hydrolase [Desulfuromonas sp.]|nr:MAG: metal-dependent hydrolase [Desulfuromonas sp.]
MSSLPYLAGYPANIIAQVETLIREGRLQESLLRKFPQPHTITSDKRLYDFAIALKNRFLRNTPPLQSVRYDPKVHPLQSALGAHHIIPKQQGTRTKIRREIRIAPVFKVAPLEALQMVVVHELAHLKEKGHDKPFYQLCQHIAPDYAQWEFDTRLYLTALDLFGPLYTDV